MILDTLKSGGSYSRLTPGLERAFRFLEDIDLASLKDGRREIEGKSVFAIVSSYTTEPEDRKSFEAHRRYLDIQVLIAGQELIFWAPLSALKPKGEYDEDKDVILFSGSPDHPLLMRPGLFALFYPQDAHKPNCAWRNPEAVRKVVVKVAL